MSADLISIENSRNECVSLDMNVRCFLTLTTMSQNDEYGQFVFAPDEDGFARARELASAFLRWIEHSK